MELPPREELLKKIEELEAGHTRLKNEISSLRGVESGVGLQERRRSQSVSPYRNRPPRGSFRHVSPLERGYNLTNLKCWNILQCMGQAVHILDCCDRVIYWNRMAEELYGYTAAEAIGQNVIKLLTEVQDYDSASKIISRVIKGDSWTGIFPVKNKRGKRFQILATDTPLYDDDRKLIGLICVSSDSQTIQKVFDASLAGNQAEVDSKLNQLKCKVVSKHGIDSKLPLQDAITSQISTLGSKISLKVSNNVRSMGIGDCSVDSEVGNGDSHQSGQFALVVLANHGDGEDVLSSGADTHRRDILASQSQQLPQFESNLNISGKFYQGDVKEENYVIDSKMVPCHLNDMVNQGTSSFIKQEARAREIQHPFNAEASGSALSAFSVNSTNSASSSGSTSSSTLNKLDFENDCLDYEILWEDLAIGEQIGQGSCGVVYHALWMLQSKFFPSKIIQKTSYFLSDKSLFMQISLMKRLRHPNVLLFMGAVASPDRLCIVTEFLPRGSLFGLLQRNAPKLDWRKRIQMALDIAQGMNYLHHFNPPIIHRDLKSSNLLVDRNWTLKVGDFGLSRLKHETYLTMRTGRGTPQWMAPEVLRNEPSDEKSDVYSFGVVLWEVATQKIPWENRNSIQVVSAVGFMDQRLEIPNTVDPQWASIIESCWHSEPHCRPTFQELLYRLKDLQRQHLVRLKSARSVKVVEKKCNTDQCS